MTQPIPDQKEVVSVDRLNEKSKLIEDEIVEKGKVCKMVTYRSDPPRLYILFKDR